MRSTRQTLNETSEDDHSEDSRKKLPAHHMMENCYNFSSVFCILTSHEDRRTQRCVIDSNLVSPCGIPCSSLLHLKMNIQKRDDCSNNRAILYT